MLFSQRTNFPVLSANPNVNTRVQSRFNQTKHAVTKHLLPTPWITRCLTPNRSQHLSNHLPLLDQNIENWKGYRKKWLLQITSTNRNILSWGCFQSSPNPSLQQKAIYIITPDGRIKKPLLVIYLNLWYQTSRWYYSDENFYHVFSQIWWKPNKVSDWECIIYISI